MPTTASIRDLRDHLPALVHQAETGKPVTITRRGKPVARLMPVSGEPSNMDRLRRACEAYDAAGADDGFQMDRMSSSNPPGDLPTPLKLNLGGRSLAELVRDERPW
jgi:prevent-host-death family protein